MLEYLYEVIKLLHFDSFDFSYGQLLDVLYFIGTNYIKFIEIFTANVNSVYGLDTSKTYFDCTNTVLLERLFQFKALEDAYGAPEIFSFFKDFRVIKTDNK